MSRQTPTLMSEMAGQKAMPMLACRGERMLKSVDLLDTGMMACSANQFDSCSNPDGVINLGTSENRLVFDLLRERLDGYNVKWEDYMFTYNDFQGIPELREAVAGFLTDCAKSLTPIDPKKIVVMNGGGICMEALSFAICDPGDAVMVASPYYGGIENDNTMRPEAKVIRVHFYSKLEPGQTEPFEITISKFESVYQEQTQKGVKIRAVCFMNPNNPLGDVYPKQFVLDMLQFCHRHSLHLIMNEVYMNTIFKEGADFQSFLSFKPEEIPDPQRVHFVWAVSKDLSMSGMRFGVIHTQNESIISCINSFTYFQTLSAYIQKVMACLLSDRDWLNNVYFPTNHKRLREAHKVTTDTLDEMGVPYLNRPSGLFVYANFQKFLPSLTKEDEMALFYRFIDDGVYIAPSLAFFADERGWFRIIFSRPFNEVKTAMGRLKKSCNALLEENKKLSSATAVSDESKGAGPSDSAQGMSLEGLLSQLKTEISSSDWLEKNTADKWKTENPELYKEYKANMK
ncbi:1-aminocyclopropane-1-carboxylate synthase-like protein 1 isoform X2 [Patiria miniata]|uniref:Aminotransferase class I/classII large domain-containing protein n=1 Tax=Patiria miniata TaxID=46514 RepID=A0A914AN56_PATMI|nr:1-aminocyclopropane-1-carboxylate synthase-like protein 1 isoform X2 [Patiria miniata]